MKSAIALICVLLLVIGGGCSKEEPADAGPEPEIVESSAGDAAGHGTFPEIPPGAAICGEHRVPEVVCPFCNEEFVEKAGHCGGHGVPEAFCTRCHPILIAAFRAEGDWC